MLSNRLKLHYYIKLDLVDKWYSFRVAVFISSQCCLEIIQFIDSSSYNENGS